VFKNKTYEPHASSYFTDAFTKELISMGIFQINRENSDAYIEGIIKQVGLQPYTIDKYGIVDERRVVINLEVALFRQNGGLIKRWKFSDYETYRSDNLGYAEFNKQDALKKVSERIARRFSAALLTEY
jgi:hypothetical protein